MNQRGLNQRGQTRLIYVDKCSMVSFVE